VKSPRFPALGVVAMAAATFVSLQTLAWPQDSPAANVSAPSASTDPVRELQDQVRELRGMVDEMRAENAQSRAEMQKLRQDLQTTRALLERPAGENKSETAVAASAQPENASTSGSVNASASPTAAPVEDRLQKLEEATSLIGSKIDEQYQTKVETASKYRARIHGIVLMNAFRNVGGSDNLDFPDYAEDLPQFTPKASLGATLRQSEIGFEIFGPTLAGARTSADVQLDFSGGFPNTGNAVNFGIVRLQTASLRFDWQNTSVVAGQDALFFSPNSPTSFASLAIPAFGYSGNLWGWVPQVRIEHRFDLSDKQKILIQGGILDNLVGEPPYTVFLRAPQAGESSAQPAYAARVSWTHTIHGQPLTLGTAAYYSRQNWGFEHYTDGWAGMADWEIPLVSRISFSGEFYRGRAIGGLGGGIGQTVIFSGSPIDPATQVRGLNTIGGWSQLKFKATTKLEFNGAFGLDNPYAADSLAFLGGQSYYAEPLLKNRSALVNFVYRPRSDLLFSAEYLRLRTSQIYNDNNSAEQFNLIMGVLF